MSPVDPMEVVQGCYKSFAGELSEIQVRRRLEFNSPALASLSRQTLRRDNAGNRRKVH